MSTAWLVHPWSWWVEPFAHNDFMMRALAASLLVVLTTSVVGTWVVLRGMSFLGDALAHGVLPGAAIAFVVGFDTGLGALVAALVMALGVAAIRRGTPLPEDTSIGVLFVGFLALAVVVLSRQSSSYVGDLNRFLFGSITGVSDGDLVRQALVAAAVVVVALVLYRALLVSTFDPLQAQLLGLRPQLAHIALLSLLAVSVVASFETVGNLLVFAFLVAPPATAILFLRRVPHIMIGSVLLGVLSSVVGLLMSYHYGTAASASMALVAVALFVVAWALTVVGALDRVRTRATN